MNAAHIHLVVNHLPLFSALFGGALLAWGLFRNQPALKAAGLVLGVVAGLGGVVAAQSGERAEDVIEAYANVDERALEAHEEAAELTQLGAVALGLISLMGLVIPADRARLRQLTERGALLLFLVVFAMVARTASLGGPIRHPEITDSTPLMNAGTQGAEDEHE